MSRPCQPSRCPATVWPSRDGRSFRWRSLCRLYGFGRFAALCRPLLSSSPRTQRQRADCWLGGLDKARYSTLLSQFNCRLFLPVSRQSHTSCLRLSPLQASRSYMDSALPQILYPRLSTRLTHRSVWGFGSRAYDSLHSSTLTPALTLTLTPTPTQHGSPSRSRSRSRPLQWHRREESQSDVYVNDLTLQFRSCVPTNNHPTDEDGVASSSDRSTDGFTWTVEEETAVRRKLDRVVVPLSTFLYLLCFLDRCVQLTWLPSPSV
jgi:hypothetical protein